MSTPFWMVRDINGYNGFGLKPSSQKYSATLAQSTDTSFTVPKGNLVGSGSSTGSKKYLAIFSYEPGSAVWVAYNATAAVPGGAAFAATSSELLPTARYVSQGDVIHFITPDTGVSVGITLYVLIQ